MPKKPNILFLMTDQMQARVLNNGHPAITPNLQKLISRGVRITGACTSNAVCSPARASLMTGTLPHTHGVLEVTHAVDKDQCNLRTHLPHWAQSLAANGYHNGYFGKWHVERTDQLQNFGWHTLGDDHSPLYQSHIAAQYKKPTRIFHEKRILTPGYKDTPFYQVNDRLPENRMVGVLATMADAFIRQASASQNPWCCFVSCLEPHDPFICGQDAFNLYNPASLPLSPSLTAPGHNQPNLYKKAARTHAHLTQHDHQMAAACYYAMVTEIDQQYGKLLTLLEELGQADNTIVVLTSDHGELLGAHGLYCKNIGAFEEVYNIPMVLAGPGIAQNQTANARVGLHDLAPTLCALTGSPWADNAQSRSFLPLLQDPAAHAHSFTHAYAEYFGTRIRLQQRILWDGPWKLIFNGFDFDELYNLDSDPNELTNLIDDPATTPIAQKLFARLWSIVHATGDHALANMDYQALRIAPYGPHWKE
jgi:arylsulfatase A-like enzyme